MTTDTTELLAELERYYDTAPRAMCDTEEVGPFTLFVRRRNGFPYYARPRLGLTDEVTPDEVTTVLSRQRELDVPRAVEWVHDTTPSLLAAARERFAGEPRACFVDPPAVKSDADVRVVAVDDLDLKLVCAAVSVSFAHAGTAVGEASVAERDDEAATRPTHAERVAALMTAGLSVLVGAFDPQAGPVGGGSHNARGDVSEVVGVGVLPAYRRRGLAGAITAQLAGHARAQGVQTVFCSAQDDAVARVYEAVGFRRVGTACIAEAS